MKNSLLTKLCVGAALVLVSSQFANAERTFPYKITGAYAGIQATSFSATNGQQVPTLLTISRGAGNLRLVSVQLINRQNVMSQTVLRANGTADTYTSVDGVIVQSGTGLYSRRNRRLNVNLAVESSTGRFGLKQQFTLRGKRVAFLQNSPQTGTVSYLLGNSAQ